MDKPTQQIEFESMLLVRHAHMTARSRRPGDRMDRSAYVLLTRLQIDGPMSIGELSEAFGLDASTLNRQTAALLRADLVERIPDAEGGIARKFRISAAGGRRLEQERTERVDGLSQVLADWTPEEVATFHACLRRFNGDIERLEGRPWPRP
jgi:DNA-binding MarR family transcriptional regulator